jgi:hypothetical protein
MENKRRHMDIVSPSQTRKAAAARTSRMQDRITQKEEKVTAAVEHASPFVVALLFLMVISILGFSYYLMQL